MGGWPSRVARWLSGRASDLRSKSRGFEARPRRYCSRHGRGLDPSMGWIGLGWVGLGWVENFPVLVGWVGLGLFTNVVIFL